MAAVAAACTSAYLNFAGRVCCPVIGAPTTRTALHDPCMFVKSVRATADNRQVTLEYAIRVEGDE